MVYAVILNFRLGVVLRNVIAGLSLETQPNRFIYSDYAQPLTPSFSAPNLKFIVIIILCVSLQQHNYRDSDFLKQYVDRVQVPHQKIFHDI